MLRYTIDRILLTIPTLLGVAVLIFFMLRIVPGDIVEVKLKGDGGAVTQETIDMERHRLGLDKPLMVQFKDWMVGVATLDLGWRSSYWRRSLRCYSRFLWVRWPRSTATPGSTTSCAS